MIPPESSERGYPIQGPMCLVGPEAWMEGQRQKGWTLITIIMLLLVAREKNTQVSLLGQGDNQMVIIKVLSEEELSNRGSTKEQYISDFKVVMSAMADKCGLVIKSEESWHSEKLVEYSRAYHYKGAQASTTLKKISRVNSQANQTIPTFNGKIAGMFSAGSSAAGEDYVPYWAYYVTCVETAHHIRRHMFFLHRQPIENTSCVLMIGRVLGGLPIVIYPQFCTSAVQDVLSSNLHLVKTMCDNPVMSRFARSLMSIQGQRNLDFETLVKDPQSLPIDMPIQPENYLKDKVKEGLSGYIRNKSVLPLFTLDSETKKKQILTDLSNIIPTNPRLLNKIYSCSSLGIQEKVIAKFSNTRSIQRVATQTWVDEDSLVRQLSTMERCIVDYYRERSLSTVLQPSTFKQIFAGHINEEEPECTTLVAQSLREVLWGRHIEGITMPTQQEQVKVFQWDNIPEEHWPTTILMLLDEPTKNRYLEREGPTTRTLAVKPSKGHEKLLSKCWKSEVWLPV